MTADVLRLAANVPMIPLQRRMSLGPLVAARQAGPRRISWSAIFTKAYAVVAQEMPVLRQAYFRFPVPHIHEYPRSAATVAVERMVGDEPVVCPLIVHDPASCDIGALSHMIRNAKTADIDTIDDFVRVRRLANLPWPLRPLALWSGYNVPFYRLHGFGTFGVTTVAGDGGELLNLVSPLPTVLTYGPFSSDATINVRVMFDHRVVDAAPIARALVRLEQVLGGPIASEIERSASIPAADHAAQPAQS